MGSFNRDSRGGRDNRGGGRSFDRPQFGGSNRGGGGRMPMFQATCSNCGKSCEVPFKPSDGRPVFCSNCFEAQGNGNTDSRRPERPNYDRGNFEDRSMGEKRMFAAVCAKCGNKCNIPFEPRNGKPVYCSNCFEGKNDGGVARESNQYKQQFEVLNNKLDKIVRLLESKVIAPEVSKAVIEEVKELKVPKVKKEIKKASVKKVKAN